MTYVPSPPVPPQRGRLQGYYISIEGTQDPHGEKLATFARGLREKLKMSGGVQAAVADSGVHYHDIWPIFQNPVTEADIRDLASESGVVLVQVTVP